MDEVYLLVKPRSVVLRFELEGDHRSANPKGDDRRIIVAHAITDNGPMMSEQWREVDERKGLSTRAGSFTSHERGHGYGGGDDRVKRSVKEEEETGHKTTRAIRVSRKREGQRKRSSECTERGREQSWVGRPG